MLGTLPASLDPVPVTTISPFVTYPMPYMSPFTVSEVPPRSRSAVLCTRRPPIDVSRDSRGVYDVYGMNTMSLGWGTLPPDQLVGSSH